MFELQKKVVVSGISVAWQTYKVGLAISWTCYKKLSLSRIGCLPSSSPRFFNCYTIVGLAFLRLKMSSRLGLWSWDRAERSVTSVTVHYLSQSRDKPTKKGILRIYGTPICKMLQVSDCLTLPHFKNSGHIAVNDQVTEHLPSISDNYASNKLARISKFSLWKPPKWQK